MPSNTALAYQMMIEGAILGSMTKAADAGNFYIASAYGKAYAEFLGLPLSSYPEEPSGIKDRMSFLRSWEEYYFKILSVIFRQARDTLIEVRAKYRQNQDIPRFRKSDF